MATNREQITAYMKRAAELGKVDDCEELIVRVLQPYLAQFPEARRKLSPREREEVLRKRGILKAGESLADHEKKTQQVAAAVAQRKALATDEAKKKLESVKAKAKALKAAHAKKK